MSLLIAGLILFIGIHSVAIFSPQARDRWHARLGEWGWKGLYSVIAIFGFVLLVWGYAAARQDPIILYTPPQLLRYLAMILLLPIFPLLLATYLPGRIQAATKHPMLVAVKLWALAHLLVNGGLHDVLLFGALLAWAVADRISLKRRTQPAVPTLPTGKLNDTIALVGGLALYGAFVFGLHAWLFGVPILNG